MYPSQCKFWFPRRSDHVDSSACKETTPHILILRLVTAIYQIPVLMLVKVAVELSIADNMEVEEQRWTLTCSHNCVAAALAVVSDVFGSIPYESVVFMLALIPGLLDTWKVNSSIGDFYIFWGTFCSLLGLMLGVQVVHHSFLERSDTSETKKPTSLPRELSIQV